MNKKNKVAASLTIHDASKMTPKKCKDIAEWLKRERAFFLKNYSNLSKRYTARHCY